MNPLSDVANRGLERLERLMKGLDPDADGSEGTGDSSEERAVSALAST